MGYREYRASLELCIKANEQPANAFYSLLMAAMREADSDNFELLREAFPKTCQELIDRYNAPGGLLKGESHDQVFP